MYPAYLWSEAPGHDENPCTSVLLNLYGLAGPLFWSGSRRAVRLFCHPRVLHSRLDRNPDSGFASQTELPCIAGAGRYIFPLAKTAQAMRASLFASATTKTLWCARDSS